MTGRPGENLGGPSAFWEVVEEIDEGVDASMAGPPAVTRRDGLTVGGSIPPHSTERVNDGKGRLQP